MKKTLLIQAARFGDLVQTIRLIKSLARDHELHLAVDDSFKILARILFPEAAIHGFPFHQPVPQDNMAFFTDDLGKLAANDFSQIFNCNYTPLAANLSRLFPEKKIIGLRPGHYSAGDILRSRWARMAFSLSGRRKITSLNLVDYWGWFAEDPFSAKLVNPAAKAGNRGLGIVLAGREPRRSLPPAILAGIANVAASILKVKKIFLFGTERESPVAAQFKRQLPQGLLDKVEDLCGKTGWPELITNLQGLDLILTPDTGTMHLAAFLGVPVMAFFLSSAWCHETAPYGAGHLIWQASISCAPCLETAPCSHNVECLKFFQDSSFLRFVAGALTKNEKILANLPVGLQLWKTGFDSSGQVLKLVAGRDRQASERHLTRKLINAFLLGESACLHDYKKEEIAEICQYLFPETDWMLPAARYC